MMSVNYSPPEKPTFLSLEKILPRHLERLAMVYVRQSTVQQVMDHRESTNLQYVRSGQPCHRPGLARGARPGDR
jgi:hypothetical protein